MRLPIDLPVTPMLAKAVKAVPAPDAVEGGYSYEPKWDGFRGIILRDGDEVEIASRGSKPLTRYFPELVEAVTAHLPSRCAVDGEIVVRSGEAGSQRLDWEALSQRIHPADSRVRRLAAETPSEFVAFDLLALGDDDLMGEAFSVRRARLEAMFDAVSPGAPIHLTRVTGDDAVANDWFERFEGAGLDGVVAKPLAQPYAPGKRTMLKIKHARTADAVLVGYRVHKSGQGVGSLLLGMYTEDGSLVNVGGISAFTNARRLELVDELDELVARGDDGAAVRGETDRSRFSASKDVSFVRLRPERVVEVAFDQLEGWRFRHSVTFLRWRPDRDPESCLIDQVDRAVAYDLDAVLAR
ncbi:ATP-dependent DNA ligase [Occultella glacieicola]|uniref:DNA ligase (ATP) n=1 Tax=Occultella glacieicola TaxID=2518684 RepID=A0ABY2E0D4_9MICO|nr:ATP-dependent DNA ligase [Occultella glacieicola]TDE90870.1 ATP-dependent DNA ligase [Occultella glacieicola]